MVFDHSGLGARLLLTELHYDDATCVKESRCNMEEGIEEAKSDHFSGNFSTLLNYLVCTEGCCWNVDLGILLALSRCRIEEAR